MIRDPQGHMCYLDITCWAGISIGAEHYYGKLICGGFTTELRCTLTERHAAALNKKSGYIVRSYKPGDSYGGFLGKTEIMRLAVDTYRTHYPAAEVLLLGSGTYAEPYPALHMDSDDVRHSLNHLFHGWVKAEGHKEKDLWLERWERFLATALDLEWEMWK